MKIIFRFLLLTEKVNFIFVIIYFILSNLYKKTSFPALLVPSLLSIFECTKPKVLNIRSMPALLALAVSNCSARDTMAGSRTHDCAFHQVSGSVKASGKNM